MMVRARLQVESMVSGFQTELRAARLQRMAMLAGEAFGHVTDNDLRADAPVPLRQRRWLASGIVAALLLLAMVVLAR